MANVLFGIGGAFVGRSWPAAIIAFVTGLTLVGFIWKHDPSDAHEAHEPEDGR